MRLTTLLLLTLLATSAQAYVGPGMGLGVIGALLGAISAFFLAIFGIFWYPIKRMIKKRKAAKANAEEAKDDASEAPSPTPGD